MTMRWPKPSMVCSRLRSSGEEDLGVHWKLLSSPHSNGSTGSITAASSSPSATCRLPRLKSATMLNCRRWLWRRDSNQPASGKPGAVQRLPLADRVDRRHAVLKMSDGQRHTVAAAAAGCIHERRISAASGRWPLVHAGLNACLDNCTRYEV